MAYNLAGEPFDVPPATAAWRVRKVKPKGPLEVIYGSDGNPLFVPLDADIEDLRREVSGEGKYRLDPVDEHNHCIPNAQASYVYVGAVAREREPMPAPAAVAANYADSNAQLVTALLESQKQHTELARMYVAQFPVLVNALSSVVRSAGDAGLPARVPLVVPVAPEVRPTPPPPDEDEDDEDDEDDDGDDDEDIDEEEIELVEQAPPEWSWARLAHTAMERFSPQIDLLLGQLPALGARLSAGRGKSAVPSASPASPASPTTNPTAHLAAILDALTPKEAEAAKALANELSMPEKIQYFQAVSGMAVSDAVDYVRAELAKRGRNAARGAVAPDADEPSRPDIGMSDAQIDAHIGAIRALLTPEESKTACTMMEELSLDHRQIWIETMCQMSVPEGAGYLRKQITKARRDARAREAAAPPDVRAPSEATPEAATMRSATPRPTSTPVQPRRDGRRAVGSPEPSVSSPTTPTEPTDSAPTADLSPVSPDIQAHLDAIQHALTPAENAAINTYLTALPMPERSAWITHILRLPVPDAVAWIRAQPIADAGIRAPARDERVNTAAAPIASEPAAGDQAVTAPAPVPTRNPAADLAITGATRMPATALSLTPPTAPTAPADPAAADAPTSERLPAPAPMPAPPVEINAQTHLLAIEQSLTAGERFLVHTQVAQMSPEVREALLDQLVGSTVPEGVAILRAQIQDLMAHAAPHAMPTEPPPDVRSSGAIEPAQHDDAEIDGVEEQEDDVEDHDALDDLAQDEEEEIDEPASPDRIVEQATHTRDAGAGHSLARTSATAPRDILPMLSPEALAQFQALHDALSLAERMRAAELAGRLSPAELRGWITELTSLPVPDALARIRAAIATAEDTASLGRKGGVS